MELTTVEQSLLAEIQNGLPLVSDPYQKIGQKIGITESEVIECLSQLSERKVIRRFGIVVKHRKLGYTSNAMVVWDIPDVWEAEVGKSFSQFDFVTLCYSRPRRLPQWRYNLFCMIHGKDRETVLAQIEQLREHCMIPSVPHEVLFSRKCFKQRGARYFKQGGVHGQN